MAYVEAADPRARSFGREQLLNGHSTPGVSGLGSRLGSMDLGSNVDSPNQVNNLVNIIEAAESAIKTQVEENEQLKAALERAQRELSAHRQGQRRQGAPESFYSSLQAHQGRSLSRSADLNDGLAGTSPVFNQQSPSVSSRGAVSTYPRQNGLSNGGGNHITTVNPPVGAQSNGPSAADLSNFTQYPNQASSSASPPPRRRGVGTDFQQRDLYQGQDVQDFNNHRSQDMMMRITKTSEDEESNQTLIRRLVDANTKEAELISEKRILERRVAELRLAFDQQQQGLIDAASKALSYRQNVLEENIRLTYALQVAEQERTTYVKNLMPLLAEYNLQPPVSDAHSMVSHIKILVQKLRAELELYEGKVKDAQYYLPSNQPSYQPLSSYNPPPQSPSFPSHGMEIVPHYNEKPTSPIQQPRTGRSSWEPGVSSPRFAGTPEDNLHNGISNGQEPQADVRILVPPESASEGFDDETFEGDDFSLNGSQTPVHESSGLGRSEAVRSPPQLPPLPEEPASPGFEDNDPLPGIEGLRIVGDAVLGGRLTACGHSVNGTALCIFQWVRHYQDGKASYIEGAAQPQYIITADDCDCLVAIECVPMDERNRRGDLVTVMANDRNWISRDPMMQDQIDGYMQNAQASFEVNLLEGTSEDISEPATLVLKRLTYEVRRNNGRKQLVNEKYSSAVSIKIPVGEDPQCVITSQDGREIYAELRDPRTRDLAVLTFRAFHTAAIDEQKKKSRRKWLRG